MRTLSERVESLGSDVYDALELLTVPVVVIDPAGYFVYRNAAAAERFGDMLGHLFTSFIAPESVATARDSFARKLLRVEQATEIDVNVLDRTGAAVPAEISAVALESDGRVVGVFGLVDVEVVERPIASHPAIRLTPRHAE